MLNKFVEVFSVILSEGVKNTVNLILFIMFLLACIDLLLAYIYEFSENFSNIMKTFFTKSLKYAFFFAIANFYVPITDEIVKTIFKVGYIFSPSGKIPNGNVGLPDFDGIFTFLYASALNIRKDWETLHFYQIGAHLVYLVIFVLVIIMIMFIIKEIIVAYVEFKLMIALGVILLPFNMFEYTKQMGEKLFYGLLNSGARLLCAVAVTGVSLSVIDANAFNSDGTANISSAIAWLFLIGLTAFLISNSKELANMLINGTGSTNSGANLVSTGVAVAVGGTAAIVGGTYTGTNAISGAISKGRAAAAGGKSFGGILKEAAKGYKEGAEIASKSRLSKVGSKLAKGATNVASYATGERGIRNLAGDIWGATGGTLSDQLLHDSDKLNQMKENLKLDDIGNEKDYFKKERFKSAIERVKADLKDNEGEVPRNRYERYRDGLKSFMKHYNSTEVKEEAFDKSSDIIKERKDARNEKKKTDVDNLKNKLVHNKKGKIFDEKKYRKEYKDINKNDDK